MRSANYRGISAAGKRKGLSPLVLLAIIIIILFASCTKHNTPTTPLNDTVDTTKVEIVSRGDFMNGPYGRVSGMAAVVQENGQNTLSLKNMNISNGPDLHVYISKEVLPLNFVDLGPLQSVAGNQLYTIPSNTDLSQYKYALIHCQRYNHLFGSAELR